MPSHLVPHSISMSVMNNGEAQTPWLVIERPWHGGLLYVGGAESLSDTPDVTAGMPVVASSSQLVIAVQHAVDGPVRLVIGGYTPARANGAVIWAGGLNIGGILEIADAERLFVAHLNMDMDTRHVTVTSNAPYAPDVIHIHFECPAP